MFAKSIYSTLEPQLQIIGINSSVPVGWRLVKYSEAEELKPHIIKLLSTWSIVSIENGKIDGPGYGCKIYDTFGAECGEKLIIKL